MVERIQGNRLAKVENSVAYRLFYPQVSVIICSKLGVEIGAMPAVSCMSISNAPPLVALAVFRGTKTNKLIRASGRFSVNWIDYRNRNLRKAILDLAKHSSELEPDKLRREKVPYDIKQGVPVIRSASAYALCDVQRFNRQGDHDLFVAKIDTVVAREGAFCENWNYARYKPAIYLGSENRVTIRTL